MKDYRVILYYNYTRVEEPDSYRDRHHMFCVENNLLGRIIISSEGINGTVSGLTEDCEKYMDFVRSEYPTTQFKVEHHDAHAFHKLHVRVKDEIVNSDLPVDPTIETGKHMEPAEFHDIINDPNVVIVDMRSNYEHKLGKFKNAITFDMENLRELPNHIDEIAHLKDKKVVTYCTGGIKCEKASAYLLQQGFTDVYQLHGGIIRYGLEEGGENFDGKCYVFDNRVAVDVNNVNPEVISNCYVCNSVSDRMVNCANADCNRHVPICEACSNQLEGACSEECQHAPGKRPYDGRGYYPTNSNNYTPLQGLKSRKKQIKVDLQRL